MKILLLFAATALGGQVAGDRYDNPAATAPAEAAPAAAATATGAAAVDAAPAEAAAPLETPASSLDASAATEYAGESKSPELAPPPAQPAEAPPIAAEPADAKPLSAAATAPPAEESVLSANGPRPTEVMATLLQPPATDRLPGTPLTLQDAVHDARTREEQTVRAQAYWDLAANVGEYNLAMVERQQLAALRDGIASPGAAWEAKLAEYENRAKLAKQAALASQRHMQQLLGSASEGLYPLPADMPHCGRYNTEYEEIFAKQPNATAKQLDELMPLRYEQLRTQARAIVEAHDWLEKISELRDPKTDGTGLLQAYDLLSLRRRAFMATARDYNQEIAAYIELAAPAQVAPDRLVAMMIRTSGGDATPPWEQPEIQQTSGAEPQQPATATADRSAAATGAVPEHGRVVRQVRRPLQRLFGRERSIVVERLQSLRRSDRNN